jgi:hypothetical protein
LFCRKFRGADAVRAARLPSSQASRRSGSPLPHLHRECALAFPHLHPDYYTSAPGLGSALPHPHMPGVSPVPVQGRASPVPVQMWQPGVSPTCARPGSLTSCGTDSVVMLEITIICTTAPPGHICAWTLPHPLQENLAAYLLSRARSARTRTERTVQRREGARVLLVLGTAQHVRARTTAVLRSWGYGGGQQCSTYRTSPMLSMSLMRASGFGSAVKGY